MAKIVFGKYSGQFRVEGLTPDFNCESKVLDVLLKKTIDRNSDLFKELNTLNGEYDEKYLNASTLSNKLFEDASEKDPEEGWRYNYCVNFDYNNYISNEPDYPKLKDMWQEVYKIKGKMRKLIIDYFFFLIKPNKLRKKKNIFYIKN